ncbi:MAG: hypothetical protein JST75_08295 [Bacteroidetes bacterium]|nr:hypothetical protein [Bacteroidota bacterium]
MIKDRFGWYAQLNGGFAWAEYSTLAYDSSGSSHKEKSNYNTYNIGFVPGVYYRVSPGILINADCGGIAYNYNKSQSFWSSTIAVNFLSTFTFGIDFIISRRKS